jgi:SAM-dependent methyltransferase
MSDFWNERFSKTEYVYGKEPNEFLKQEIGNLTPGKILFLGEGEGRNAVYAATIGWDVDAFDQSEQGKRKAELLAEEKSVKINYQLAELYTHQFMPDSYDAVALIYFHIHEDFRKTVFQQAASSLRENGRIILELYDQDQVGFDSGGPREKEMLYSLESAVNDFVDLDFETLSKEIIDLNESRFHQGKASVIRFVGIKK